MPQQQTAITTNTPLSHHGPSERERFIMLYERESATTQKVLAAYPAKECELKPHDRSNSALALARTFVIEQALILLALKRDLVLGRGFPKTADTWEGLVAEFNAGRTEILNLLRNSGDDIMNGTASFYVAPKQVGEYPLPEFVTFMTHDQIHHRGQMSVYLRMAGAKVPSIYGPSADEPWN